MAANWDLGGYATPTLRLYTHLLDLDRAERERTVSLLGDGTHNDPLRPDEPMISRAQGIPARLRVVE